MADDKSELMAKVLAKMMEAQGEGLTIGANDEAVLRISDEKSILQAKDGSMNYYTRDGDSLSFENEAAAYKFSCYENAEGVVEEMMREYHPNSADNVASPGSLEVILEPMDYLESLLEGGVSRKRVRAIAT